MSEVRVVLVWVTRDSLLPKSFVELSLVYVDGRHFHSRTSSATYAVISLSDLELEMSSKTCGGRLAQSTV